ncbi:heterokaryon incompatibility protein-domain-containing protein [Corynascus novoguineensis]|uniref:Heterokaryon incompatibility protein-domain-containing protein n=1 Tax=Corynascus novoguineensis TaxID=1126955 RepID=A0AAN7CTG1_9PEZI|nr:heterokaryon incompatibility protein-domain-containing protein [Corynascus novoguineensis]
MRGWCCQTTWPILCCLRTKLGVMNELKVNLEPLCSSCGEITLDKLLKAIPIARCRTYGSGVSSSFDLAIRQPLSFPQTEATGTSCALCSLVSSLSKDPTNGPLELAALGPSRHAPDPIHALRSLLESRRRPFAKKPKEGKTRIDCLKPMTRRSGPGSKSTGIRIRSTWQISVAAEEGSVASSTILRRPLLQQGSEGYFEGLLRVIDRCNSSHPRCRLGVDGRHRDETPSLPTRVIDVGSAEQRPRIIVSQAGRARYATLSHCWGGQSWVGTTTQNLAQMLDGFDVTTIPATYADAITMTKRLGIRFLWIDSFCIIQNDHDDWLAESQKMGEIYENAYLNIAATGANGGMSGFLKTRKEDPVYVRVPSAAGQRKYDWSSTGVGQFYFTNQADSDFDTFVTRAKLNTRGWVLQERILSRRSVHFAADMWYWECGRHIISEDGWQHEVKHTGKPPPYSTTSRRQALDANVTAIGKFFQYDDHEYGTDDDYDAGTDISSQPVVETEVSWAQILRAYSRCDLTFSSDKLPALQGLVNRFKQTAQRPYVFGHWIQAGEPLPLSLMCQDVTQPALMLQEVGSAESQAPEIVDGEGGKDVKRYKRIGIANIKNHDFFDGVAVSSLIIV